MMVEPIYTDNIFIVKQSGSAFVSSILNFPLCLRKIFLSNGELYHSSMENFETYRDKFKEVLRCLEPETDDAFHVVCVYFQTIESASFSFDINNKMTPVELANLLLLNYRIKKEDAIKSIECLIANNEDLNYREEEERDQLIYRYGLVDKYKEFMVSNFTRMLDNMTKGLDELKTILNTNNDRTTK